MNKQSTERITELLTELEEEVRKLNDVIRSKEDEIQNLERKYNALLGFARGKVGEGLGEWRLFSPLSPKVPEHILPILELSEELWDWEILPW